MESNKPKLVFIASRFPYPLEKGDKLRSFHLIKELAKSHRIYLISLSDETVQSSWIQELEPFTEQQHVFQLNRAGIALRLITAIFQSKPFQVAYFTSFFVKRKINQCLKEIEPDHIFCQMLRPAEYVKNYHWCPKTIDFMDSLSIGMQRRASKADILSRWIFRIESERLREYEQRIFNYFEHHVMISKQDAQLIAHPDHQKISIIPNGIDAGYFSPQPSTEKRFDLVFVGNLSYAPNVDAIQWLYEKILKHNTEVSLLVAGANPGTYLKSLANKNKQITLAGWQNDIRDAYSKGRIFIAPMQIGTGMQNKLLEAMSMAMPCITTPLASIAIEAMPNEEILVGSNDQEILSHIRFLLQDPKAAKKIGDKARKCVLKHYHWEESGMRLAELFTPQH